MEPVEPPFVERPASGADPEQVGASQNNKLVVEMPFNNDITFPIKCKPAETVGDLRRRIATAIGVESSRVMVSRSNPTLQSDVQVADAAHDNRLQLVVRSSFDFERLRQLIEEDNYTPILPPAIPPPALPNLSMSPSPLQSPDLSGGSAGFPWRSPMMSPRRNPRQAPRVLRLKLANNATIEFNAPQQFAQHDDHIKLAPELVEALRAAGINNTVSLRDDSIRVLNRGLEAFNAQWHVLRNRGFTRALGVLIVLLIVGASYSEVATMRGSLTSFAAYWIAVSLCVLHMAMIIHNRQIHWVDITRMPAIYRHEQVPQRLIEHIPLKYRNNTDLSDETVDKIVNEMRMLPPWYDFIKVYLLSIFPSVYEEWENRIVTRRAAHRIAVRMATERNVKTQEDKEKSERLVEEAAMDPVVDSEKRGLEQKEAEERATLDAQEATPRDALYEAGLRKPYPYETPESSIKPRREPRTGAQTSESQAGESQAGGSQAGESSQATAQHNIHNPFVHNSSSSHSQNPSSSAQSPPASTSATSPWQPTPTKPYRATHLATTPATSEEPRASSSHANLYHESTARGTGASSALGQTPSLRPRDGAQSQERDREEPSKH